MEYAAASRALRRPHRRRPHRLNNTNGYGQFKVEATSRVMILDGVPTPGAIAEDGVTHAGVDARDGIWQHPDLLPDADDLDEPAGFIDRVIGGDTGGIDEAIAKLEREGQGPDRPGSDGGSVDN